MNSHNSNAGGKKSLRTFSSKRPLLCAAVRAPLRQVSFAGAFSSSPPLNQKHHSTTEEEGEEKEGERGPPPPPLLHYFLSHKFAREGKGGAKNRKGEIQILSFSGGTANGRWEGSGMREGKKPFAVGHTVDRRRRRLKRGEADIEREASIFPKKVLCAPPFPRIIPLRPPTVHFDNGTCLFLLRFAAINWWVSLHGYMGREVATEEGGNPILAIQIPLDMERI